MKNGKKQAAAANYDNQAKSLRNWAIVVISYLVLLLVVTLITSSSMLAQLADSTEDIANDPRTILLCILAGIAGSSVSALISTSDRVSHGWEFSDGTLWPKKSKFTDMFGARMITWFLVRPFLGAAMGFVVFTGIVGGLLIVVQSASTVSFSAPGLAFLAFLSGLFAKTFLEKLRNAFNLLFAATPEHKP